MISTDWRSETSNIVFADFETQSLADLRKIGGRAYAVHPSTRIMCCGLVHGERRVMWVTGACPHQLPETIEGFQVHRGESPPDWVRGKILCGHNALEFDAHVWERFVGPATWRDTLPLCRAGALPGGLGAACERIFGLRKDERGKVLEVLMKAYVNGGQIRYPVGTPNAWHDLTAYCCNDALLLEKLHGEVIRYVEPDVLRVNQIINDRGIPIDIEFAQTLIRLQEELATASGSVISDMTEDDLSLRDIRSTQKVKSWLKTKGVRIPEIKQPDGSYKQTLSRDGMRALLSDPLDFCEVPGYEELVTTILRLRQEVVRVTSGKALRMIEAAPGGRARGQFTYCGAGPGRWSGREIQPHNFPRGVAGVDVRLARANLTLAEVRAEAERLSTPDAAVTAADVLGSLLRPVVAGPLAIGDFGQVEARGVCWIAGEEKELNIFRNPSRDVYVELAKVIFGTELVSGKMRKKAKDTALGCGYGMSASKFGSLMKMWGDESDVTAETIVGAYRKTHPRVVALWKELDTAMHAAVAGHDVSVGPLRFHATGTNVSMDLPSGRSMIYRDARVEMLEPYWARMLGMTGVLKPTVTYMHQRGYRTHLYGGKLAENATQAICRDLLAGALVRAEDAGLRPVIHVHDEIGTEEPDADALGELMSQVPSWATGFPVLAEVGTVPRYCKLTEASRFMDALRLPHK